MITLLDGPGIFLLAIPAAFIIFMIVSILLEGWIMKKIIKIEGKIAMRFALVANIASLAGGWLTVQYIGDPLAGVNILIYYAITCAVEFLVVFLMNKRQQLKEVILSILAMNIASYIILVLIFLWMYSL